MLNTRGKKHKQDKNKQDQNMEARLSGQDTFQTNLQT